MASPVSSAFSSPMLLSPALLSPMETGSDASSVFPDYESTVLAMAILSGDTAQVETMVNLGARVSADHRWTLYQACLQGTDMLKALLRNARSSSRLDISPHGDSILHLALRTPARRFGTEKAEVVELLLNNGADPFRQDRLGETALHILAAMTADEEIELLRSLLDNRGPMSYLDQRNIYGDTALIIAVTSYNIDAARLLLEVGADPNVKGEYENTAYQYAHQQGNTEMLELLYQFGADSSDYMDLLLDESAPSSPFFITLFLMVSLILPFLYEQPFQCLIWAVGVFQPALFKFEPIGQNCGNTICYKLVHALKHTMISGSEWSETLLHNIANIHGYFLAANASVVAFPV
ncbi:Palmitoyltransferase akr1 [Diaporthe amygdali]|uniref:Palmitoyltransferase akr1 n=1 Tax=Phomopsis amygdali TaxID=1214568 RepID=UPI0022FE4D50|nr:Palmitoyltransferase akr1 [Diaporthe amygdali]KAJ0123531.1 Palmitoyltransferase akr1 [Diaporthe amygdali]